MQILSAKIAECAHLWPHYFWTEKHPQASDNNGRNIPDAALKELHQGWIYKCKEEGNTLRIRFSHWESAGTLSQIYQICGVSYSKEVSVSPDVMVFAVVFSLL